MLIFIEKLDVSLNFQCHTKIYKKLNVSIKREIFYSQLKNNQNEIEFSFSFLLFLSLFDE